MRSLSALLPSLLLSSLGMVASASAQAAPEAGFMPVESTKGIAILSGGRIKPLETYAEETLLSISGKSRIEGYSPLEILWGFSFAPADFRKRAWIRMDSQDLKQLCGLSLAERRFSFNELMGNKRFREIVNRATKLVEEKEDLSTTEKDARLVYGKLMRIAGFLEGTSLRIVPWPKEDGTWSSPYDLKGVTDPMGQAALHSLKSLSEAWIQRDGPAFAEEAGKLSATLRRMGGDRYPSPSDLDRELLYNRLNAFGWAWKAYLVGFLLLLFYGFREESLAWPRRLGLALVLVGFVFHTVGLALRWAIAGRAPVSDMYESLVFMSWGILAIGIALEFLYKTRFFIFGASLMGFLALMFSEHLPLDSGINPLVASLAHTSWLSVHVMTIMLSYSAFALAMGLGHIVLGIQIFRPGKTLVLRELSSLLYKTLQVGILFLAAGIIFGAIWANESWGRYWGWDKKETWSLITFFVYMAIIHARFAAWIGHFGLAMLSIMGFLSVVMTYYGVNFLMQGGLHSYGASSGGVAYAIIYAIVELTIMLGAWRLFTKAVGDKSQMRQSTAVSPGSNQEA